MLEVGCLLLFRSNLKGLSAGCDANFRGEHGHIAREQIERASRKMRIRIHRDREAV